MKKQVILLALMLFCANWATSQIVRNLKPEVDDEKVTFTFDLTPQGQYRNFDVCLKSYNPSITPKNTTGDIGKNQIAGINKKIYWYYANDGYTQDQISNLKMDVIAINPLAPRTASGPTIKPIPIYAGLGGVATIGLGLAVTGLVKHGNALDTYQVYKDNLNDSDAIYTELGQTREEVYDEANKQNKNAQYLIFGGGAVFIGAGIILFNRIKWMNRINKMNQGKPAANADQCSLPAPRFQLKPVYNGQASFGLGLCYTF